MEEVIKQNWLYDLWDPVQNKTMAPLVPLLLRPSRQQQQSIKQAQNPECRAWETAHIRLTLESGSSTSSPLGPTLISEDLVQTFLFCEAGINQ